MTIIAFGLLVLVAVAVANPFEAEDDEAADEERGLPLEAAVGPERGQRFDPGVASCDSEQGDERSVEPAKLIGCNAGEDRHTED